MSHLQFNNCAASSLSYSHASGHSKTHVVSCFLKSRICCSKESLAAERNMEQHSIPVLSCTDQEACQFHNRSCNTRSRICHTVAGEGRSPTARITCACTSNQVCRWQPAPIMARCFRNNSPSTHHCISPAMTGYTSSCSSDQRAELVSEKKPLLDAELVSEKKSLTIQGADIASSRVTSSSVTSRHPAFEAALQVFGDIFAFLKRELYVSYRFVGYDLTSTVLPGTLLTLVTHMKGATLFGALQRAPLWRSLPSSFVWMWLFVYVFTLANQANGGAEGGEDALNKPTRPIPSGVVTVQGGYQRLVWVSLLFVLLGTHLHTGLLSALWVANVLILECWGPSCTYLHWLIKPIAMMIGIFITCVGNPSLVAPIAHHRPTLVYMSTISVAMGLLGSSIQDIRDVEGDRQKGDRSSLPIVLGDMPARHLCNFLLLCSWGTLHTALIKALSGPYNLATSMAILLWCLLLCYRTLAMRSPAQDHKTYLALVYLYSFLLVSYSWVA